MCLFLLRRILKTIMRYLKKKYICSYLYIFIFNYVPSLWGYMRVREPYNEYYCYNFILNSWLAACIWIYFPPLIFYIPHFESSIRKICQELKQKLSLFPRVKCKKGSFSFFFFVCVNNYRNVIHNYYALNRLVFKKQIPYAFFFFSIKNISAVRQ